MCRGEYDAVILTMSYLKVILIEKLHNFFKFIFHKAPPYPRKICTEIEEG